MERFYNGKVFHKTDNFILTGNRHNWDTNYHLLERVETDSVLYEYRDHLIDILDFWESYCDDYKYVQDMDFTTDEKIKELLEIVWKTI